MVRGRGVQLFNIAIVLKYLGCRGVRDNAKSWINRPFWSMLEGGETYVKPRSRHTEGPRVEN